MKALLAVSAALLVALALRRIALRRRFGDIKGVAVDIALLGLLGFFVSFFRAMSASPALALFHLATIALYLYALIRRYLGLSYDRRLFGAPLASLALFFGVSWLFREV